MRKKIIQVPVPEDLLARLDHYSKEAGTSRAALIREACAEYVTRSEESELLRQDREGYAKYPESNEDDDWRRENASKVWGEEDWSDWEQATP